MKSVGYEKGSSPEYLASALFIVSGALGLWQSAELATGDASAMGPGYFPRILSALLIVLGSLLALKAWRSTRETIGAVKLRPVSAILIAIGGFAMLAAPFGFVVAASWLIGVGSLGDRDSRFTQVVMVGALLILASILLFVVGLGVQISLWPI